MSAISPYRTYPYRSWVEISRGQIAENFRAIGMLVGPAVEVMPVARSKSKARVGSP
jgi:hypothetical protein